MFKKINNLRIKHKFLIMCISFLTIGVVADIGLYEFSKITDFQRLEREYLAYLDVFVLHFKELEYIKKPEKNSKHVYRVLDRKSDLRERMGLIQTLEGMRQVAQSILETANPIEKFFLSVSGFGEAFHIADDNYDDIIVMQHTIEDYRNNDITYDNFIRRVNSFVGRIRQYDDAFARIANETSHFVSAAMISIGTIFLIVIAIISIFLYREAMKPLNEAKESIYTSSQELQTNSKQQLQSASSQTTAMNEISSVMQELVATSRQVSESSSRANTLAQDTNNAVRESHKLLDKALEGTFEIKEKMEIISSNMLSLGEKAQQIGIVLDV
ncbi:MAG: hypothetical protein SVW57_06865, partial [Thermodesulfobacteriota bacterium]|nr:hypothetical protein [Thermodesulfobacteriota bacterium]